MVLCTLLRKHIFLPVLRINRVHFRPLRIYFPILTALFFAIICTFFVWYGLTLAPYAYSVEYAPLPDSSSPTFECKPCNFTSLTPSFSTPRDAVFAAVTTFGAGVKRMIRSLRTSGCQASIILFVTDNVIFPSELTACNLTFVQVGPLTERASRSPYKIRWEWYHIHLQSNIGKYDRIFHVDAFDTFFFGDPFSEAPNTSVLYFQMEDRILRDCPYNKQWILSCHYDVNRYLLLGNTIACSGSLIGGAEPFRIFSEMLITHTEWPSCWGRGFDQGDFNYILYTQFRKNYSVVQMGCNSGFLTMNYCSQNEVFFDQDEQLLTPDRSKKVVFVHQYNRYKAAENVLTKLCL
jgi:hypothetical protein